MWFWSNCLDSCQTWSWWTRCYVELPIYEITTLTCCLGRLKGYLLGLGLYMYISNGFIYRASMSNHLFVLYEFVLLTQTICFVFTIGILWHFFLSTWPYLSRLSNCSIQHLYKRFYISWHHNSFPWSTYCMRFFLQPSAVVEAHGANISNTSSSSVPFLKLLDSALG